MTVPGIWFWFWRYLTRGLIWHLSKSSILRPSIYIRSTVKSCLNCSWNQPVLSNKGKVSCPRKQRGHLMGLKPTTSTWVRNWFQVSKIYIYQFFLNNPIFLLISTHSELGKMLVWPGNLGTHINILYHLVPSI